MHLIQLCHHIIVHTGLNFYKNCTATLNRDARVIARVTEAL